MPSQVSDGVSVPLTDTVLRLTPRWGELDPALQATILTLSALVPLALVLWLYRYELRLVSRAVAGLLLILRVAVVGLVWFVLCMQPVLVHTASRELPSRVVVAVDISGSMGATDPDRPAAAKLRLARALHLPLPGGPETAKLLDDWIKQYEKKDKGGRTGLQWVDKKGLARDAGSGRKLAERRRALHDRVCREVDRLTRLEIALRLLTADGAKLLRELAHKHQVEILGFQEKAAGLRSEQLDRVLKVLQALKPRGDRPAWELKPEQTARLFRLNPPRLDDLRRRLKALGAKHPEADWGPQPADLDRCLRQVEPKNAGGKKRAAPNEHGSAATDLAAALEHGLRPAASGQGTLVGVLLLTDGQHNAASSPARPAEKLGKRAAPIYPVVVGTAEPRPSVTLAEVQAPARASSREDVTVRVRFKVAGLPKQDITVSLERADRRPGRPKDPEPVTVSHDGADRYYDRTFVAGLDPEGKRLQTFVVRVRPATRLRAGAPSQEVVVRLDDAKPKVLLVDGEARWEYHYLANALNRDPGLDVRRVLFAPPLLNPNISEEQLHQIGNPERRLPEGPDALADYQCIVLGDVAPEHLPPADRKRLEQFVARHGGTLVVVAGKRFMPLAYQASRDQGSGIRDQEETDPIVKLLPVEEPRVVEPGEGFRVGLTPDGKLTPFLQMEADAKESAERWASFPPHYWAVVGKAKPAATALAFCREVGGDAGVAADRERDERERQAGRGQALIARQNYGRGQVLFVGLDSTWRWRYRVGDTYHHRFWGQVMRWASADYVRFGTDKPVYQEGQDVNIDLSLRDNETRALPPGRELKARVVRLGDAGRKEKVVALVPLSAPDGLRVLKGRVPGLPAGRYRVELDPSGPVRALKLGEDSAVRFQVTPRDNREMDRLEANVDLLRDLAHKSGNPDEPYTPADARRVVERLASRPLLQVERSEQGLWQREWGTVLLVVFLVLVTAEWVGRKWAGLP